jgi:hypothetical protein
LGAIYYFIRPETSRKREIGTNTEDKDLGQKLIIQSKRLTDKNGHYFFGYYDLKAFSRNGRFHLFHRVGFNDRLPQPGDEAVIGFIDLESRRIHPVSKTLAWNFQQGSMLQWNPAAPDQEIIFNAYLDRAYKTVIMDVFNGRSRTIEAPMACIDAHGRYGLSINFCRLYRYRSGYGYVYLSDPYNGYNHPEKDGVFRCDLETGEKRLILSLDKIWRFAAMYYKIKEAKLVINHLTFNPAGNRFVLLARTDQGPKKRRVTIVITSDVEGKKLRCLHNQDFASHYFWKNDDELLIYCRHCQGKQLYLWQDDALSRPRVIDEQFFRADGHCSYSPDRKWVLYDDSNPIADHRNLYLYQVERRDGCRIGCYFAEPKLYEISRDLRCDLHPRWNHTGTSVSFDSVHEGTRQIYLIDLNKGGCLLA